MNYLLFLGPVILVSCYLLRLSANGRRRLPPRSAAELGVDLDEAAVIDPRTSELCDQFADQYAALRKNKGVTVEQADEIIHDDSYFGTMLVYNGIVDGMVSGAAHAAACTVRPAFEIIRTAPDVPRCPACS